MGSFEPQLIAKHQTRWTGFDDKILSLYARGMTVREIQSHLEEMYGTVVPPTLISSVTDAVMDEVKAWQARPLDALYPIVYLDCIHAKVRDAGCAPQKSTSRDFKGIHRRSHNSWHQRILVVQATKHRFRAYGNAFPQPMTEV